MRWTILLCAGLLCTAGAACGIAGPSAEDDGDDDSRTEHAGATGGPSGNGGGSVVGSGGGSSSNQASSSTGSGNGSSNASSTTSTGSGAGSGSNTATTTTSGGDPPDPNCYVEPIFPSEPVTDIVSSYGGSNYKDQIIAAMDRRWPAGAFLLTEQKNDPYFAQFSDSSSWTGTVSWLDTLVHEETHLFNAYHAIGMNQPHALYFRDDLILYLPQDQGFPRSEIMSQLAPALAQSTYASTYLTGSQGARLFNPLLDEFICYVNEIPGMASFGEYYSGGVSLRDGSAAFLNFLQVYLRVARTNHTTFYNWAKSQQVYVDAVRILWLRTHFFYEEVGDMHPNLGISDDVYRAEAYKMENLAEIEMFIGRKVGASSCLLD